MLIFFFFSVLQIFSRVVIFHVVKFKLEGVLLILFFFGFFASLFGVRWMLV